MRVLYFLSCVFDGGGRMLPEGRGLIHLVSSRALRITDCEIGTTGRHALLLDQVDGEVRGNSIAGAGQSGALGRTSP